jgi:mevalonate kinase
MGDHAAVYGYPCLVTAVDLRFHVTIAEPIIPDVITISTPELRVQGTPYTVQLHADDTHFRPETAFVEAALRQLATRSPFKSGFSIITDGPSVTYGLGSSSAITAATLAALAHFWGIPLSQRELFDLAFAAVLAVQGTGSGVDLAAAIFGGTVYYVNRGEQIERLPVDPLPLIIGYSGAKVSTTNLIAQVAALRERQPTFINPLLRMLGELAEHSRAAILQADWPALGDLMNIHQGLLDSLGVSTPALSRLIFAARQAGAYGAKLSGAGGGDCMYALASEALWENVAAALTEAGGLPVRIAAGAEGVRLETSNLSPKS